MKNKFKMGVREKILIPFIIVFLSTVCMCTLSASKSLSGSTYDALYKKLDTDWKYINDLLDANYDSEWSIKDKSMYKGNQMLGDGTLEKSVNEVFDEHLEKTGTWSLVFMKEYGVEKDLKYVEEKGYFEGPYLRIAGSTRDAKGNRVVGTRIQKNVSDTVEKSGEYMGEANVSGKYIYCIYRPLFDKSGEMIGIMVVGQNSDYVHGLIKSSQNKIFGIAALGIILGIMTFVYISLNMKKDFANITNALNRFKKGDLKARCDISSNDEFMDIGIQTNEMMDEIAALLGKMNETSSELLEASDVLSNTTNFVNNSSEYISDSMNKITQGITSQAEYLEEAHNLTTGLSTKINTLSNESLEMIQISKDVKESNLNGINAVVELKSKTEQNNNATQNIENVIMQLDEKTSNIEVILNAITFITNQTNLLSLNASIEAARAGEAGKGFSVVALEIRNLATASAKSTNKIKTIINNIKEDSQKVVEAMQEVKRRSKEQTASVNKVNDSFEKISTSTDNINEKIENIDNFIEEINVDKNVIVDAMQNISKVSEDSAASTQEVAGIIQEQVSNMEEIKVSSDKLNTMAKILKDEIGLIK